MWLKTIRSEAGTQRCEGKTNSKSSENIRLHNISITSIAKINDVIGLSITSIV